MHRPRTTPIGRAQEAAARLAAALLLLAVLSPSARGVEAPADTNGVAVADDEAFRDWLVDLRRDAMSRGISEATLDAALDGVAPIPRVVELDRSQPEFTMTFDEYMARVVNDKRVAEGRRLLAQNRALLDGVAERYGVPARVIVALWGIETSFGTTLGSFRVIPALVTLAYEGRRGAFFRGELMHAFRILEEGHVTPDAMMGSWAGAMGQNQFMPSSFVAHAVDADGDGRRDIWGTRADVFASTANYLASSGWERDRLWGREVRVPAGIDTTLADRSITKPLSEWQRLGIRRVDGSDLPSSPNLDASLIFPGGAAGKAYLVYANFEAIMKWNRSTYFATAVGVLSDRIGGR